MLNKYYNRQDQERLLIEGRLTEMGHTINEKIEDQNEAMSRKLQEIQMKLVHFVL